VARQIHDLSRRRNGPFVAINCAALVETLLEAELFGIEERTATDVRGRRGKFEAAEGGTLFLDEVSDLSLTAQAKLLRAIQDLAVERVGGQGIHRVDIRIIAATNRSLTDLVQRRLFRLDLFYRLSGVDVHVPTLRERRTDALDLALYFLERHRSTRPLRLSAAAADALISYDWPGNVRELERLMERAVTLAHRTSSSSTICRRTFAATMGRRSRRRFGGTTRSAPGRAGMCAWCSIGARATSAKHAPCSKSATTRFSPISAFRFTSRPPRSPRKKGRVMGRLRQSQGYNGIATVFASRSASLAGERPAAST
jgi:transcriptional regulator with GAF, ATPase, and Fis domain